MKAQDTSPSPTEKWEHRFIDGPDTSWHPGRLTNLDMSVKLVYEERMIEPQETVKHTAPHYEAGRNGLSMEFYRDGNHLTTAVFPAYDTPRSKGERDEAMDRIVEVFGLAPQMLVELEQLRAEKEALKKWFEESVQVMELAESVLRPIIEEPARSAAHLKLCTQLINHKPKIDAALGVDSKE